MGGGYGNEASGYKSTIGGGVGNTASGDSSTVGGGQWNTASGISSTVAGGTENTASGVGATVAGGSGNTASNTFATVGGGEGNTAEDGRTTVCGGMNNIANTGRSTVGGGESNTASSWYATVGGGLGNTAGWRYAVVCGGQDNSNQGEWSVIPGGDSNTIALDADYSMAFGNRVFVNNAYRVVFFDSSHSGRLGINRDDNDGGISHPIHVGTNTSNGNGAYLSADGLWTDASSKAFKTDFQPLDGEEILREISSLPLEAWRYKSTQGWHIGPYAEDFAQVFGVGTIREDGTRENQYLAASDVAGVALAGVKELTQQNQELRQIIEELRQRIGELEKAK